MALKTIEQQSISYLIKITKHLLIQNIMLAFKNWELKKVISTQKEEKKDRCIVLKNELLLKKRKTSSNDIFKKV